MTIYKARRGQVAYGYSIGILCAEWHIPFIPGDLNNANTFGFPVRYLRVSGVSGADVLSGSDPSYEKLFVDAAQRLEAEGVRAITGNCGFMGTYQDAVADAVSIPVFMSSLRQAPLLTRMLGTRKRLGVMVANSAGITDRLLLSSGINDPNRVVLKGLEDRAHFNEVIIQEVGTLDESLMSGEVVETALQMVRDDPSIGAFLLECSDLPPYSAAVSLATGLPVYDWAGFIRYVHDAAVPRTYRGIA
jgi:aspartate/glutamate racemase